jgi:RimJ/RimL family protein N-acetyltransferase
VNARSKSRNPLQSERVVLRAWQASDRPAFAALNADPHVTEHFPAPLSTRESNDAAAQIHEHFARHGFGLWALELPGRVEFAGFVGLTYPSFQRPLPDYADVAWRLSAAHWGHGYATEAARLAVRFGFEQLGFEHIVSCTVPANLRSQRVMEKLGMRRDPLADFEHPRLPPGHPLRSHVLYRLARCDLLIPSGAANS